MATLDEILAYVAETPGNTNPAVLATLIGDGSGGGGGGNVHIVEFTRLGSGDRSFSPDYETIYGWWYNAEPIIGTSIYDGAIEYLYLITGRPDGDTGLMAYEVYFGSDSIIPDIIYFGHDPELAAQGLVDGGDSETSYILPINLTIIVSSAINQSSGTIDGAWNFSYASTARISKSILNYDRENFTFYLYVSSSDLTSRTFVDYNSGNTISVEFFAGDDGNTGVIVITVSDYTENGSISIRMVENSVES